MSGLLGIPRVVRPGILLLVEAQASYRTNGTRVEWTKVKYTSSYMQYRPGKVDFDSPFWHGKVVGEAITH